MIVEHCPDLIGPSPAFQAALALARQFALLASPVLLVGPTGCGKTRLARLIHAWSHRSGDFVSVTGGELIDTLFHKQLFGNDRGAYTGASEAAPGVFERAAGGTLFLDELQHWSRDKQAAVLAALEERRFTRVGGRRDLPVTCRLLFATTVPVDQLMREDRLLPDLFYRIGEFIVVVPALAARRADIAVLAQYFVERARASDIFGTPGVFDAGFLERLLSYDWPGNVRELERVIEYALVRSAGRERILAEDLPERFRDLGPRPAELSAADRGALVAWALQQAGGRRKEAAALLGVHVSTMDRYRKEVGREGENGGMRAG